MSEDTAVPVKTLLLTVFNSIFEVFLLCIAGYVLSRAGVTDKATQRKLNVLNVSLFTPALLFSKVAFSLTPAKLKEMWIIPLGFVLISGLSAAVAWVMSKMFRLKKSQTAFAICAAMFQNSNSLPIALIQSLVMEVPGLKWGVHDTKDQMLGRALTYLVLYSTLGMMLRWSWGVKILSQADEEAPEVESVLPEQTYRDEPASTTTAGADAARAQVASPEALETHPGARETDPFFSTAENLARDQADENRNPTRDMSVAKQTIREGSQVESDSWRAPASALSAHSMRHPGLAERERSNSSSRQGRRTSVPSVPGPKVRRDSSRASFQGRRKPTRQESGMHFLGLPDFPKRERIMLAEDSSDEEDDEDEVDEEWGSLTGSGSLRRRAAPVKSFMQKTKERIIPVLKSINAFLTVPMYAALLSIFIALVPPLQRTLNQLDPLERAIKSAGSCSIPVTLVVLGAFFYTPPAAPGQEPNDLANGKPTGTASAKDAKQEGSWFKRMMGGAKGGASAGYPGENKAVFVAVMSRMVITPLLLLPLIALIARYDLFEAAEDPVFILSAVLLVSSPPALTLAQITQAASGDAFERLISKTISWSYAVLTPPLTLAYVVIGLIFGRL